MLKDGSTSEYAFTRPDGQPYSARTSWRYLWLKALKDSGINKLRFHDLSVADLISILRKISEDYPSLRIVTYNPKNSDYDV